MFGDKLRQLREEKGVTQQQLADALGITKSAISNYECGAREPKENETWTRIASYFSVSVDYLMCNDGTDVAQYPPTTPVLLSYNGNTHKTIELPDDITDDDLKLIEFVLDKYKNKA